MRILGPAAVCFLAVLSWAGATAPLRAAPPAQAAAPASDIYTDVYNGWKWWHVYCYRCHGTDALGTTTAPSLIEANEKMPRAQFIRIVRDGVKDKGMAAWDKLLDAKQMGQLYVYVRARADKVLPPGRPDEVGPNKGKWEPGDWTPK
ncbi:MAG TPA: cytochrome c [Vicinamibacterales bacterium]|nr:cytochrome c [Vicinamibacterales bacterium]